MKTLADLVRDRPPPKPQKRPPTSEIADLVNTIATHYGEPFQTWHWVVRRAVQSVGTSMVHQAFRESPSAKVLMWKLKQIYGRKKETKTGLPVGRGNKEDSKRSG